MNALVKSSLLLLCCTLAVPTWASSCDEELRAAVVSAWDREVAVTAVLPRRGESLEDSCELVRHGDLLRVEPAVPASQVTVWWRQRGGRLIPMRLEVVGHAKAWVASRQISKGASLSVDDFQKKAVSIAESNDVLFDAPNGSFYLAAALAEGELLRGSMVRTYKPVTAGEIVQVSARHGLATVGFPALAVDNADIGGLATVQTKWGETLHVRITSPGHGSVMP